MERICFCTSYMMHMLLPTVLWPEVWYLFRFFLDLDIAAPKVAIPTDFYPDGQHQCKMFLDLGYFSIKTLPVCPCLLLVVSGIYLWERVMTFPSRSSCVGLIHSALRCSIKIICSWRYIVCFLFLYTQNLSRNTIFCIM